MEVGTQKKATRKARTGSVRELDDIPVYGNKFASSSTRF